MKRPTQVSQNAPLRWRLVAFFLERGLRVGISASNSMTSDGVQILNFFLIFWQNRRLPMQLSKCVQPLQAERRSGSGRSETRLYGGIRRTGATVSGSNEKVPNDVLLLTTSKVSFTNSYFWAFDESKVAIHRLSDEVQKRYRQCHDLAHSCQEGRKREFHSFYRPVGLSRFI